MQEHLPIEVKGHLHIEDDLGNVLIDKGNAIHPQNMARVISRALSRESNYYIHRIAFGNGGTSVNAAFQVTFKTPNDGLSPDLQEWRSRLYNETYSEVIDDSDSSIGVDLGSAGPAVGTRPGGGSVSTGDPLSVEHVSGPGVRSQELGVISQVTITSVLNPSEPLGQLSSDVDPNPGTAGDAIENTEGSFVFDEIGLYTSGASAADSNGIVQIDLGTDRNSDDIAGLIVGKYYRIRVAIGSSGSPVSFYPVDFKVPEDFGSPLGSTSNATYGDICEAINTNDSSWDGPNISGGYISITDNSASGAYSTIVGENTFGFLQITDIANQGSGSQVRIDSTYTGGDGSSGNPFSLLEKLESGTPSSVLSPVDGSDAGIQNNPVFPQLERERLLSHIIFSPITKTANRTIAITYTLTVSVARST